MVCEKCGASLPNSGFICKNCGAPIKTMGMQKNFANANAVVKRKRNAFDNFVPILLITAIILIIITFAIIISK